MLDLASLPLVVASALVTYLLHSTLLLAFAWLILRISRSQSHVFTEKLWKAAAICGLLTTSIHLAFGIASPVYQLRLAGEKPPAAERRPTFVPVESMNAPFVESTTAEELPNPAITADAVAPSVVRETHSTETLPSDSVSSLPVPKAPSPAKRLESDSVVAHVPQDTVPDTVANVPTHKTTPPKGNRNTAQIAPVDTPKQAADARPADSAIKAWTEAWLVRLWNRHAVTTAIVVIGIMSVLLLSRFLVQMLAFGRRLKQLQPLHHETARSLLDELRRAAGLRRKVFLFSSYGYSEPVAFGVFRWRIVLPTGLERELPRDELRALLAHELAHLARGDAIWIWIGHGLCTLFAFQPLNFVARRGWRRAAEFQCDDWAIGHCVAPLSLARCLTRVAERRQAWRPCAATLSAVGAKSTLSHRVERLVSDTERNDPWQRGRRRRLFATVVVVLIAAFAVWGPCAAMPAISNVDDRSLVDSTADHSVLPSKSTLISRANSPTHDDSMLSSKEKVAESRDIAGDIPQTPEQSAELAVLIEEMSALASEAEVLRKEAASRPELQPAVNRLVERIGQLQLRIQSLRQPSHQSASPVALHEERK